MKRFLLITFVLLLCLSAPAVSCAEYDIAETASELVSASGIPEAGSVAGDWTVTAAARLGMARDIIPEYAEQLKLRIKEIYEESSLRSVKVTDLQRIGLALAACGEDITDIGGQDLLADASYDREKSAPLTRQGINGLIFALILLNSSGFDLPERAADFRQNTLSALLAAQNSDGGWSLAGGDPSETDMTAMALQALAPHRSQDKETEQAVLRALSWLSEAQDSDGGFFSSGVKNSESAAQVIIALCALGTDPSDDERFLKPGGSPIDSLMSFRTGKGFSHTADGEENEMASSQALLALAALDLQEKGERLYDLSKAEKPARRDADDPSHTAVIVAVSALFAGAALTFFILSRRKNSLDRRH